VCRRFAQSKDQAAFPHLPEAAVSPLRARIPIAIRSSPALCMIWETWPLVAKALHAELGNLDLIETNGKMLSNASEWISILLSATENTTVFIDECQGMNSRSQHILLTALSEKVIYIPKNNSTKYKRVIPLKNFTLLLATTHEYYLQDALRNRIRIYSRFAYYALDNLIEIIRQRCLALKWQIESEDILMEIAQRSKKTPRIALNRNLQMCWSVCSVVLLLTMFMKHSDYSILMNWVWMNWKETICG
jgi:replication-associated recombination protein RarA